jgi:hypothetical protein
VDRTQQNKSPPLQLTTKKNPSSETQRFLRFKNLSKRFKKQTIQKPKRNEKISNSVPAVSLPLVKFKVLSGRNKEANIGFNIYKKVHHT